MIRHSILAAAIASLCSAGAHAGDLAATYFFGDSLSDSGNFSSFLPPGTGRFTTNPGPVWAESVAAALGTKAIPATAGGTDFAQGGARVKHQPGVPETNPLTGNATPIADQISGFLATTGGRARGDALYSVWGGANDLFRAIDPSKPESANPIGYMLSTASDTVAAVSTLRAAGARYVLVPTMPDVGTTPFGVSLGPLDAAAVTGLSSLYNRAVFGGLAAAGMRVIPLDIFSLVNEAVESPARFGFVDVSHPACGATPSVLCTQADLIAPGADQNFLFADGVHPTTGGHRIVADYALSVLRAPGAVSQLAESPVHTRESLVNTIGDQVAMGAWTRSRAGFGAWASAGAGRLRQASDGARPGADGNPYDLSVGIDAWLSPAFVVGAAYGASSLDADFSSRSGSYRQDEQSVALYAGLRAGPLRATAIAAAGELDFDTRRAVRLGPAKRTMQGDTDGTNLSVGVEAEFDLATGKLRHGPLVGADWQQVRVEGFRERGRNSTAMAFRAQQRDAMVGRIGYQLHYDQGRCQPYARIALNHDFADQDREVRASLVSLPENGFALPAFAAERSYGTATVGVAAKFSSAVSANVALTGRFARDDVAWFGLQAGIQLGF